MSEERLTSQAQQFFRFLSVGAMGFVVDGVLLTALMQSGWKILPARLVSFISAVTLTWLLNRLWTFRLNKNVEVRREYASYIATQIIGALINFSIFFALIEFHPSLKDIPLIPLAFGAVVSLVSNYIISKIYVFKGQINGSIRIHRSR